MQVPGVYCQQILTSIGRLSVCLTANALWTILKGTHVRTQMSPIDTRRNSKLRNMDIKHFDVSFLGTLWTPRIYCVRSNSILPFVFLPKLNDSTSNSDCLLWTFFKPSQLFDGLSKDFGLKWRLRWDYFKILWTKSTYNVSRIHGVTTLSRTDVFFTRLNDFTYNWDCLLKRILRI